MKFFSYLLLIGLLIGRNLPFNQLISYGLGPWDFFAIIFGLFLLLKNNKLIGVTYKLAYLSFLFIFTSIIGIIANMRYGIRLVDFLEVLRILYGLVLVGIGSYLTTKLTRNNLKQILFLSGLIVFIFAYRNPMNPDVLGFVQIWNPNVVGNALILHVIIIILMSNKPPDFRDFIYVIILLFFTFFTYSKASWILIICIIPYLILKQTKKVKFGLIIITACFSFIYGDELSQIVDNITILIESKIHASGFDKSAAHGSSVGARYGLALSGLLMFFQSPFFGVGIGNFEIVNILLRNKLGDHFYVDDNANSLVFHYLGTTGFIGAISVLLIIILFYQKITKNTNFILKLLTLFYLLISVNFQRELFTSNTMWLFIGIFSKLIGEKNDSIIGPGISAKS